MNLVFPSSVSVTAQQVDLSALTDNHRQFYTELLSVIIEAYTAANKPRVVIGLAGPTGSGKSVMAALLTELAKQLNLSFNFQTLGMDAFHYPNSYLETHTAKDGKILKQVKGRYDSYDVKSYINLLKDFSKGATVSLPEYSRTLHNPVQNVYTIMDSNVLLLTEGLWLLYDKEGWEDVSPLLDYTLFIEADKELVKQMVLRRHERGGRNKQSAEEHYANVDAVNFDMVMQTREKADKIIPAYYAIS